MTQLFINIKELVQVRDESVKKVSGSEMSILPTIKNAFLLIKDELISDFGAMNELPNYSIDKTIDCSGRMVFPSWCDSHTHIVYADNREQEFKDRIKGFSYEEIANNGGGILNSAKKLNKISEQDLYQQSSKRLEEVISLGTGAIEIKSGYGLTVNAELKMLRVIKKLKQNYDIPIKATFLGAHAIPKKFKNNKEGYIHLIIDEMLPKIANENLADFIDIFCETGYFSVTDTDKILTAAKQYNLIPKIHVNQFNSIGGIEISAKHNAISVDHLEILSARDLEILKISNSIPVVLPSCSFFLNIPYASGRKMIDNGLALAIASDYNPGSSPSGNMNFVISTACIKMNITPEEAINAATINGAYAMNLSQKVGSITKGKFANFFISKEIPSFNFIPYNFGSSSIETVYTKGKKQ
ncbi:MAG: imidazolonepropionase [Polaribacter sp.]|jgi:imidazolonepropionase|nr:imidazolonepropionase [Polaribacter sp.]